MITKILLLGYYTSSDLSITGVHTTENILFDYQDLREQSVKKDRMATLGH